MCIYLMSVIIWLELFIHLKLVCDLLFPSLREGEGCHMGHGQHAPVFGKTKS